MLILKIGGGASINLRGIIQDLAGIEEPVIIVHGANALRDELAHNLGREKTVLTSVRGYQSVFSDDSALELIMMAYAGLRNKQIVEMCQQEGINAVGLSGIDGRMIQGRRNAGIRIRKNGKTLIKRDRSGKPQSINIGLLRMLLENGYIPILCIPIVDEQGTAINSENDDIVARIHESVSADRIIQFIEAPGFLAEPGDESSLLPVMTRLELGKREQLAEGRIKRKLFALQKLFQFCPTSVIIADGRTEHPLNEALAGKGTLIR
jgi:acetylglutamate/LysW-gamma-L-alpha-aminoadipate kinase